MFIIRLLFILNFINFIFVHYDKRAMLAQNVILIENDISISISKALPVLSTALATLYNTLQLTRIDSNGKEGVYILVRIIGVVCGIN